MARSYTLDPLYVNQRRVLTLVGAESLELVHRRIDLSEKERLYSASVAHAHHLAIWLRAQHDVFSFEADWCAGRLAPGRIVTVNRSFTFRNARGSRKGITPRGKTTFANLGTNTAGLSLQLLIEPDHIVPGSPGDLLERKVGDLFVVASILMMDTASVDAVPLFIGHQINQGGGHHVPLARHGEIFPDDIDNFSAIRDFRTVTPGQRAALRSVPEATIKQLLARILQEVSIPKDWGGERSDLFTTNLRVQDKRVSAAFLLKGPAGGSKFRPMTIADLGRNGDQITRLATEPANLLVLQHCHDVTPPVRDLLRVYSSQGGRERHYCVIDGDATARLFLAYGHLLSVS